MRLTCPNCGAQYEVPDEVIPSEGRDVQCSNCGDTWFQDHPNSITADDAADTEMSEAEQDDEFARDEAEPESQSDPTPEPEQASEPELEPEDSNVAMTQQELDPAVAEILREEAEHEARLRAAEAGIESQPDLGLDDLPDDEAARRSRESRDRMARMRGEDPEEIDHPVDAGSRRGLLPDIEEINSTLRASGEGTPTTAGAPPVAQPAQKGGFARGFGLIVLIVVVMVLVYINAQKIAVGIPQTEAALNAYVALVDQGRVWLDSKVSGFMPK